MSLLHSAYFCHKLIILSGFFSMGLQHPWKVMGIMCEKHEMYRMVVTENTSKTAVDLWNKNIPTTHTCGNTPDGTSAFPAYKIIFLVKSTNCSILSVNQPQDFCSVLLCMWAQAARVKFHFDLFPISSNFKSSPLGKTDHGRSCASAAGGDCSPSHCQPAWCPVMCGGWVFLSWPGWALGTYPWVWVQASHGESKDQVASGLWSFPCICGSRSKTLRLPAFCRGKHNTAVRRNTGERIYF